MKKQVLNQIESLVKQLNKKNEERSMKYTISNSRFDRGQYSVKIVYSLFFSTDFEELMKIVNTNDLLMWLAATPQSKLACINIQ